MAKHVNVAAQIIEVAVRFTARPGDQLLVLNGVCLGIHNEGVNPNPIYEEEYIEPTAVAARATSVTKSPRAKRKTRHPINPRITEDNIIDLFSDGVSLLSVDISDKLGLRRKDIVSRSAVSRVLKLLCDKDILKRMPETGHGGHPRYIQV